MDDYIRRSDVLELAREYYTPALREEAVPVRAIKNIPSADVVGVKHGGWEYIDFSCRCSECGGSPPFYSMSTSYYKSNFCPNCGARMVEHECTN